MRKLNIVIIAVFVFLLNYSNIRAMTLEPSGEQLATKGQDLEIYINLNRYSDEKEISAIEGILSYDSSVLTLVSSSKLLNGWTEFVGINNGDVFCYANLSYNNLITDNVKSILKLKFKIKEDAKYGDTLIKITNTSATDESGNLVDIEGGKHVLKIVSDINTLTNISVESATLNFNEENTDYNLTIDKDTTVINVEKKDASSSVTGDIGTQKLNYGLNIFKIKVTSENNISKIYTLNIERPDNRSKINTLSSLSVDVGKIDFNENVFTYNLTVDNNVSSVNIYASLSDNKSEFVEDYAPRTVKLDVGKNIVEIKVRAENEQIETYKINIIREKVQNIDKENQIIDVNTNATTININFILIALIGIVLLMFIFFVIKKFVIKQK